MEEYSSLLVKKQGFAANCQIKQTKKRDEWKLIKASKICYLFTKHTGGSMWAIWDSRRQSFMIMSRIYIGGGVKA